MIYNHFHCSSLEAYGHSHVLGSALFFNRVLDLSIFRAPITSREILTCLELIVSSGLLTNEETIGSLMKNFFMLKYANCKQ